LHFDFGENLRHVVARDQPTELLSPGDIDYLRDVLARNALLEDRDFPIAERILRSFLSEHGASGETRVVLNGLPRHQGQARDLEPLLDVQNVIRLRCTAETVLQRIAANTGGDRQHRRDDDLAAVRHKLGLFRDRTEPLIDHYRQQQARIIVIDVTVSMTPEEMWASVTGELRS
jgi:adenylate kinase family enzyme